MNSKPKHDRRWLLATAKSIAEQLRAHSEGTRLRLRIPHRAKITNTDGWSTVIGDLGRNQPRLEVWFDRFSGYADRKLYAGFRSEIRQQIISITNRVDEKLWPVRVVTPSDYDEEHKALVLDERLGRAEFNRPVLEKNPGGRTFYGIYDQTRDTAALISPHFCARAIAFFEDVARALPNASVADEHRDVYPRLENRKRVAAHLRRERSKLLALECKIRDNYVCQVCWRSFEEQYGQLGKDFAEAHHRVPLSRLRENVRTRIEDLITVCANCHRMLHRMSGNPDDVKQLQAIWRRHRK
ncbi:MAG TPA: HNH endonuclease [Pirellulaceae bacterium]|jgi:5-methylcytosine-specific restriction endonuclease McrA|nr:HNH endonuclease [Pirellulaceae bacterium]